MTNQIRRYQPGEKLRGFPVESWRIVADSIEEFKGSQQNLPTPFNASTRSFEIILNKHTVDLDDPFQVLRLDAPVNKAADNPDAPYQTLTWEGIAPDSAAANGNASWVVLQKPAAQDRDAPAVLFGPSWVKVDVQSESDLMAGPIDGDVTKLKSGYGVPIIWKESGTGIKWAIVQLGANKAEKGDPGLSGGSGIMCELFEDMAVNATSAKARILNSDGTPIASSINVAEIVADATARLLMVEGAGSGQVEEDDIVEQTNGSEPSTYFQYDGGGPSTAGNWTAIPSDTHCIVIDPLEHIEGYGPYTAADSGSSTVSGSSQRGFTVTGAIFATNYLSTGFPGVLCDSMQSLAPMLVVRLVRQLTTTSWEAVVTDAHGSNWCERWPKQETFGSSTGGANYDTANFKTAGAPAISQSGNTTYGITVANGTGTTLFDTAAATAAAGELWLVAQTTEHDRYYSLVTPVQDAVILKGTAQGTPLGNTIAMDNLTSLYGPSPLPAGTQSIIATYDQANFHFSNGDTLYAFRDKSISTDILQQWRLTSAFDIRPQLKGLAGWDTAANADQVLKNREGVETWVDTEETEPSEYKRFELTSIINSATARATANLVDDTGTVTTTSIYVSDVDGTFYGLPQYTNADDATERGYRGLCKLITGGTEYIIVSMEAPAQTIQVRLNDTLATGLLQCDYLGPSFGGYQAGKPPVRDGVGVAVFEALSKYGLSGQTWYAEWNTVEQRYDFTHEVVSLNRLRGTVVISSGVTADTDTFAVALSGTSSIASGRLPVNAAGEVLTSIDVTNTGGFSGVQSAEVSVYFDRTAGNSEATQWRTRPVPAFQVCAGLAAQSVTEATGTFNVSGVSAIRGKSPASSVSVTNDPPMHFR